MSGPLGRPAASRTSDGLYISDRRVRRLTAAIVALMMSCFTVVVLLTVFGTALDGLVGGSVPWAWIAGVGLWVLSIALCELYIHLTRFSPSVGGDDE